MGRKTDLGNKHKTVNFIQGVTQDIQNKTKAGCHYTKLHLKKQNLLSIKVTWEFKLSLEDYFISVALSAHSKATRVCVCMCVRVHAYAHVWERDRERGREKERDQERKKERGLCWDITQCLLPTSTIILPLIQPSSLTVCHFSEYEMCILKNPNCRQTICNLHPKGIHYISL